jgi:hypothetical protein
MKALAYLKVPSGHELGRIFGREREEQPFHKERGPLTKP